MSVYNHPNKPGWQMIKISHGRKEKPEYIPFPGSREEAQIYEREIRGITDLTDPGFLDNMAEFKIAYKNEVMPGTYTDFEWALKQLQPFFENMKLRHITPLIIEQYKAYRLQMVVKTTGKTISKRTINRELTYLSKYLAYCGCQLKPVKFRKKDTQAAMPNVLLMEEMERIIEHLPEPHNHLVRLMTYNGLRKNEVFTLRAIQTEKDGSAVQILGKGGKWRVAPIEDPSTKKAIVAAKKARPDGYLFPNPKTGEPYKDIRKQLKKAATAAGVDKRIYNHLFRHSFGTELVNQDVNLRVVQGLLGHADLKTVQIYTHLVDKTLRAGVATLVKKRPKRS